MTRTRLTISSTLQLYFDQGGRGRYSPPDRSLESVEAEVGEWQEFVERWLESTQPPSETKLTMEEKGFLSMLRNTALGLTRSRIFQPDEIRQIIKGLALSETIAQRWPSISQDKKLSLASDANSDS